MLDTILWDDVSEEECEATIHRLRSKGDVTWKEVHEIMLNHQLEYDCQLYAFLTDVEMTLSSMRDEVWATIHCLLYTSDAADE